MCVFNVLCSDWEHGLSLPRSHFYSKLKEEAIDTSGCFLGLSQLSNFARGKLLDSFLADLNMDNIYFNI
jgi:hypothetical protein